MLKPSDGLKDTPRVWRKKLDKVQISLRRFSDSLAFTRYYANGDCHKRCEAPKNHLRHHPSDPPRELENSKACRGKLLMIWSNHVEDCEGAAKCDMDATNLWQGRQRCREKVNCNRQLRSLSIRKQYSTASMPQTSANLQNHH